VSVPQLRHLGKRPSGKPWVTQGGRVCRLRVGAREEATDSRGHVPSVRAPGRARSGVARSRLTLCDGAKSFRC
jgi:hypothetical protein